MLNGVQGPVCAWSTGYPPCGARSREGTHGSLMPRRYCWLLRRHHTWGSISARVWSSGRKWYVVALPVAGLALETGLALSY